MAYLNRIKKIVISLNNEDDDDESYADDESENSGSDEETEVSSSDEKSRVSDPENIETVGENVNLKEDQRTKVITDFLKSVRSISGVLNLLEIHEKNEEDKLFQKYILGIHPIIKRMKKIKNELKELDDMVGMKGAKKMVFDQMMFFLQGLHENELETMLHTIIEGPPGVGKTELGFILCKIYTKLGVLKSGKYILAKRSDLIAEYVGQTAIKTQNVINKALGGVLFIDEAYSIGDKMQKDPFAKECIDTLNQNLTEHKKNFMCIIAGYKDSLEECFFSLNEGLKRRFNFRISIDKYSYEELHEIFLKKICESGWCIKKPVDKNCPKSFFSKNINLFPFFGGDIETYLFYVKLSHSSNLMGNSTKIKKCIDIHDLNESIKSFKETKSVDDDKQNVKDTTSLMRMYI